MSEHSKLDELVAYEEIRRLVADYAHGADKRDAERFRSVWTEDAAWQPMPGGDWSRGLDAIMASIQAVWDGLAESHHWFCNLSIRVEGDTATGLSDADCVVRSPDDQWFRIAATYSDTYAREEGRWGIKERTVQVHHHVPIAAP